MTSGAARAVSQRTSGLSIAMAETKIPGRLIRRLDEEDRFAQGGYRLAKRRCPLQAVHWVRRVPMEAWISYLLRWSSAIQNWLPTSKGKRIRFRQFAGLELGHFFQRFGDVGAAEPERERPVPDR